MAATLYDTGFVHFERAASDEHGGELVYAQGQFSPGTYARGFLERQCTEEQLLSFRAIAELAQAEELVIVPAAVAKAVTDSGVATRPSTNLNEHRRSLQRFVYTGMVMQPVFAAAAESGRKCILYAEGEDDRVLRAARVMVDGEPRDANPGGSAGDAGQLRKFL